MDLTLTTSIVSKPKVETSIILKRSSNTHKRSILELLSKARKAGALDILSNIGLG
jgi:hypothetical protein